MPPMSALIENLTRNIHDLGILVLRVGVSGLMLTHGVPKLQKLVAGGEIQFPDPIGVGPTASLALAVFGEVVAPAFLIVGFLTRWAAIPAAVTMAVAAFVVHWSDPLADKELALVYLVGFATLFFTGAGHYSIDGLRTKRGA
jgi:putative oxidoreductase